jgi:hypothetical protein
MYGRPGLVRRRPLLRAAAVGGAFAAGRAMRPPAAEPASAGTRQGQRPDDLAGQPGQPLLRAGGEGQPGQSLLRAGHEGQQHQSLLRAGGESQPGQSLLRAGGEGQQHQPLLRTAQEGQHQPLMQAGPAEDTGLASAAGQLSKLAELHLQGELTDEEFAAAKAMTLGRS